MTEIVINIVMWLLMMSLLSKTCQANPTSDHHRSKRLTAIQALNYGCTAARAVRECTDLLEDCNNVCDKIDTFCEQVSSYSDLLEALCGEDRVLELKTFFTQELPKLAKGGAETEKALKELGGHFESLGEKILGGLRTAGDVIKGKIDHIIRFFRGDGCQVTSSETVMVTSLLVGLVVI